MNNVVIAFHDYGTGGVGMLVRCNDPAELAHALGNTWKVMSENVEEHPYYVYAMARNESIYDFSQPSGLLASMLFCSARESEGKSTFPIRVGRWWRYAYRDIWARSKQEVEEMFPGCEFLYGKVLTKPLAESDIDAPDGFIEKYGERKT